MRVFAIADASKRKAKPIGIVTWRASSSDGRGEFSLEIRSGCNQDDLPLSLSFLRGREGRTATPEESKQWVRSRIVPENRHNIAEVLRANGLAEYDEANLLAASKGRSSDDDLVAYEVQAPDSRLEELDLKANDAAYADGESRADKVIDAIERRWGSGEYHYAFITLPRKNPKAEPDGSTLPHNSLPENAAHRIGRQIRRVRTQAGLTQSQLAAKVGITQSVLSRVESGNGNPTLSLLEDIATTLGSRLEIQLDGMEKDPGASIPSIMLD